MNLAEIFDNRKITKTQREAIRKKLADDVEKFLATGGKIKELAAPKQLPHNRASFTLDSSQ